MTESSSSISSNAFSGPTDKRAPAPFEIRGTIAALIDSRSRTDRRMSRLWALIPALILWIFVFSLVRYAILVLDFESYWSDNRFYDLLTASYVACIPLFAILFGAMIYKSIRRTNLHLSREDSLRAAVMSFLRGESTAAGKESQVMDGLLSLSAFDGQSVTYEKRHNAVLWGVGIPLLLLAYPSFILLTMAMIESDG